jgi:hypothetical protein
MPWPFSIDVSAHPQAIEMIQDSRRPQAAIRTRMELRGTPRVPVWQRNYYEHVIRDDADLNRIRQYIIDNPARWAIDRDNPAYVDVIAEQKRAEVSG